MTDETKPEEKVCETFKHKQKMLDDNFLHTKNRLEQKNVVALVQFAVVAFNCQQHDKPDAVHIVYSSAGSNVPVPGGLAAAITGVEALLAALKAKLQ